MRYVDTNVFGYAVEDHPKYGMACRKILEDITHKKLRGACSMLVAIEFLGVIHKINKELTRIGKEELDVRANMDAITSLPLVWLDINFYLLKRAAEYSYPTTAADHIHIASMELHGIREIISADSEFDKVESCRRIDPLRY